MAKVDFDRGNSSNLSNTSIQDGRFIYTQNTQKLYLDDSNTRVLLNPNPDWNASSGNGQILNKPGNASSSASGLMSSSDKSKLDGFGQASSYATKTDLDELIDLIEYTDPGQDDPWNGVAFIPGIYPVVGTQTQATLSWTGNLGLIGLYDGLTIAYYTPYAGSGSVTLNLTLKDNTTTGAIPVYYTGQTYASISYEKGTTMLLTYWSAGSIKVDGVATSTSIWVRSDYNATYGMATSSSNGLMSSTDKARLDSMAITYTSNTKTLNFVL